MIACKIFDIIHQTKIRTSRLVTETLVGFSFEASAQPGGFSRAVENSDKDDKIRLDTEMDVVFVKRFNPGFMNRPSTEWKSFRIFQNALNGGVDFGFK